MLKKIRWQVAQTAELLWWQRYLQHRSPEDYLAWKTQYWRTLLTKIGQTVPSDPAYRVLDAGCGPAGIFMIFDTQAVDALDPLLSSYEAKLPHFRQAHYPNVTFLNQSLETLDAPEQYDLIFSFNAINHVQDLPRALDALIASAKKGATLVISTDAHNHGWLKPIFRALPGDVLHPQQHGREDYEKMLTDRLCTIQKTIIYDKTFIFDYLIFICVKQ
jgi:SAM-dependent methyltransferase